MAYLTDYEKRILFSALNREKEICKDIDKDSISKEIPLTPIVESLERKFYYDRYEKEIRAKAIDEFVEKLLENAPKNWAGELDLNGMTCYLSANKVMEIAEQMKENEFFNFSSPVVRVDEKSYNKAIDECIKVIEETAWKDTDMLVESIRELKGGVE